MTRRPEVFSQSNHSTIEANASGKRKRGDALDQSDSDNDISESESDDAGDEEADEEELREKRRATRKKGPKKAPARKGSHAAKKPKVASNGVGKQLAFRPATNGRLPTSRPRKITVRPSLASGEKGLYGEQSRPMRQGNPSNRCKQPTFSERATTRRQPPPSG
jgi:cohesin complex subunit SA-1/2